MEVADAVPIQMVMPTTPASEQAEPFTPAGAHTSPAATPQATPAPRPAHTPTATPTTPDSRQSTPDSPLGSAPSPPPARSEEAVPFHIFQLRSQLQRIEAMRLQFKEETKVFQTSFINFLYFQFSNAAAFFTAQPTTIQPTNFSTSTQPKSKPKHSVGAGNTEKVHFSSDDENDIFNWHTPMEHHGQICATPRVADFPESSTTQKRKEHAPAKGEATPMTTATNTDTAKRRGKTPAGWIMLRDRLSSPEEAEQPPAKRQRRYHVITADSDDNSSAGLPVEHLEQLADPSLSHTF
ncbi:hypothetical protein V6N11_051405 [Hibiscus sabdariffa]|uniref:Uncharacterized protein n=1 Tax=Hibiscus sabdariffa TaxID=183260 RepID=A0ABR2U708_9ROSI